ncbi:endonuclease/exonuclease/phosphatase family protein [Nonomuraea sp. NPDC050556]|uniref:endonuclease/exonuclease/phosphatase family protein n=1 Tax=Nonomuraea sp. NPDC050556 TaxID=3364369 RepID=UPI0037B9718E
MAKEGVGVVRVATLNVWGQHGPWGERLRLIREELAVLQPDVIGLQEVVRRDGACQAAGIADGLGYEVAYAPAVDFGGRVLGNALLSRWPVVRQDVLALPVDGVEPRALLRALVDTPAGTLPVFVTHLDWELDRSAARVEQVRFIVSAMGGWGGDLPAVLLGDFNAEPGSAEIRFLCGSGLVDAWEAAGDGSLGMTFDVSNDYARLADEPSRRLDYVFTGAAVGEVRVVFNRSVEVDGVAVWPSDHFGVMAELVG